MKIFYLTPDNQRPCGGITVIYQQVSALRELGVDAYIVHEKTGFRPAWLTGYEELKIIAHDQAKEHITPSDWVVIPDAHLAEPDYFFHTVGKKIALIQGQTTFNLTPLQFQQLQYQAIIVCSDTVHQAVKTKLNVDAFILMNYADPRFKPGNKLPGSMAYMPRKNTLTLKLFTQQAQKRDPHVILLPIDGLPPQEVAHILGQADYFISTTHAREGFGLPILEAMRSGCVVLGQYGNVTDDFIQDKATMLTTPYYPPHWFAPLNYFFRFDRNARNMLQDYLLLRNHPNIREQIRAKSLAVSQKYNRDRFMTGVKQLLAYLKETTTT